MGHDHAHAHGTLTATGRHRKRLVIVMIITLAVFVCGVVASRPATPAGRRPAGSGGR